MSSALLCLGLPGCVRKIPIPDVAGLTYSEARVQLIDAGWTPERASKFEGMEYVRQHFPEVRSCRVDRPVCVFAFRGPGSRCLQVLTVGERIEDLRVQAVREGCRRE